MNSSMKVLSSNRQRLTQQYVSLISHYGFIEANSMELYLKILFMSLDFQLRYLLLVCRF